MSHSGQGMFGFLPTLAFSIIIQKITLYVLCVCFERTLLWQAILTFSVDSRYLGFQSKRTIEVSTMTFLLSTIVITNIQMVLLRTNDATFTKPMRFVIIDNIDVQFISATPVSYIFHFFCLVIQPKLLEICN